MISGNVSLHGYAAPPTYPPVSSNTRQGTITTDTDNSARNRTQSTARDSAKPAKPAKTEELTPEEKKVVSALSKRDQEVRAHEAAHIGAGGGVVRGGASYSYQSGPDGKRYAVGGEVGIDASPVKDNPEATIRKMQIVRAAALAPADPSGQDCSVAAAATAQMATARMQLSEERNKSSGEDGGSSNKLPPINSYGRSGQKYSVENAAATVDVQA